MNDNIQRLDIMTKDGNTLSFFYNPDNNLIVVDLIHKNDHAGVELLRKTLNEKKLLAHATTVDCRKEEDSEKAKAWK